MTEQVTLASMADGQEFRMRPFSDAPLIQVRDGKMYRADIGFDVDLGTVEHVGPTTIVYLLT